MPLSKKMELKRFIKDGEHYVWTTGLAMSFILWMTLILFIVIFMNGMTVFWPSPVIQLQMKDGTRILGELEQTEEKPDNGGERVQIRTGNRDLYGIDFRWVDDALIESRSYPAEVIVLERKEYGNFYGSLVSLQTPKGITTHPSTDALDQSLEEVQRVMQEAGPVNASINELNEGVDRYQKKILKLEYRGKEENAQAIATLKKQQAGLNAEFQRLVDKQDQYRQKTREWRAVFQDVNGKEKTMTLDGIVRFYAPNQMSLPARVIHYLEKIIELLIDEPRESNTEGGLFPAIFGTVMLIFLMSFLSFPMGTIAGIYLREYAKEGPVVRMVRIAVNNLAGVPSIVYGIFGLAFFIYGVGGTIDQLFFPERLPTPTWGTGGILWASLTLGLLTVPVVIVSTEEALDAIPSSVREASYSLGATQFQTLVKILIPMASPGIMTGLILAMARAAGEVAPLMLTGVVKLAPALPVDGSSPFMHFNRKFMHLGFHIYDVGFQSPNVEAAKPFVFVTTLLLVGIVMVMSSVAIYMRNKMKRKYTMKAF